MAHGKFEFKGTGGRRSRYYLDVTDGMLFSNIKKGEGTKMMKKMAVLGAALILSCILCSVSEAADLKKAVIGKWFVKIDKVELEKEIKDKKNLKDIEAMEKTLKAVKAFGKEFVKDGTYIDEGAYRTIVGSYKFIDDNRLKIEYNIESNIAVVVFSVSIDKEGTLLLTYPTGEVMELVKKAKMEKILTEMEKKVGIQKAEVEKKLKLLQLRLKDNGDGTVTDSKTGLMWTKDSHPLKFNYPHDMAPEGLAKMNKGEDNHPKYGHPNYGHNDWRLPSNEELRDLLTAISEFYNDENFQDIIPFTDIVIKDRCYYSESRALTPEARDAKYGLEYGLTWSCAIWPVRAGQ